jgi:hypothetical protein
MKTKYFYVLLLVIIYFNTSLSQISSGSIGGSLHLGSIQGNSIPVTSLGGTLFIDFFPWFENDVSFRIGYTHSQKVEYFLPEDRTGRYYPLLKIFSLKGFIRQVLSYPIYIEEGAGFIYLNDRTLANVNEWEIGTAFSALIGLDFRKKGFTGVSLGVGLDYGVCFTGTNANFYLIFLQTQYYF